MGTEFDVMGRAEEGDPEAQEALGVAYYFGDEGLAQDMGKAGYWLQRAASQRQPFASLVLATMFGEGLGGLELDPIKAHLALVASEEYGLVRAKSELAVSLLLGQGCMPNADRALALLREAANLEIEDAQYYLGSLLDCGFAPVLWKGEASHWLKHAIANGADPDLHGWLEKELNQSLGKK